VLLLTGLVLGALLVLAVLASWRWGLRARADRAAGQEESTADAAERVRVAREIARQIDTGRDAGYRATSNLPPSL
jgi:hypothetical protein